MVSKNSDKFVLNEPIRLLSVIVAAYNERETISIALHGLHNVLNELGIASEIIVVESNSTDGTREIVRHLQSQLDLKVFYQENPEGKGSAVRKGLEEISGDVFLIYDADNEYDPSDIPRLLAPISNGKTSFVLGTRHEAGRPMRIMQDHMIRPFLMNAAHRFFTFLINSFFHVKLTDPFTMYKVFRVEVFHDVDLISNRFDLDWELVAKAIRRGAYPLEVPVSYNSRSFTEGKKVRFLRDPMNWLVALIRFRICKM